MGMFLHKHLIEQMKKEKKANEKPVEKKEQPRRNTKKG